MDALGALRPSIEPRATQGIRAVIAMIRDLVEKGPPTSPKATSSSPSTATPPTALYNKMIAGARVEVAPFKRNPMDFVLWKPSTDDLPGWESPWGRGRPLAHRMLGHVVGDPGGTSTAAAILRPHHENEIAQSPCAHPHGIRPRLDA